MEFTVLELTEVLKISFRADEMSWLFAIMTTFVWLMAGIYSFGYMAHDNHKKRYAFFYIMVYFVLLGLDFSANLITMYLFYEMMTLFSMPLILHDLKKESVSAAMKYLYYSIAGAFLALFGIFVLSQYAPSMDFVAGGHFVGADIPHKGLILAGLCLAVVGFGAKAGLFPLHAWLPIAHPVAPAPASAVLSGVVVKSGVLAVIRTMFYVVGADVVRGSYVQKVWMILALLTIVMGSTRAFHENVFKKRLAYSTVSQLSYVLFGIATLHPIGLAGAMLHILFHSVAKSLLFMSAGSVIHQTGKTHVSDLKGVGRQMPITFACFTLGALSLVGIPPFAGFFSKWYLANGALASQMPVFGWLGPVILLLSALLTAGYLFPISVQGFLPGKSYDKNPGKNCEAEAKMTVPMIILAVSALLLGVFSSGIIEAVTKIAEGFM